MRNRPLLFAVSGVKNSGKTTLIRQLIPVLSEMGLKTAVIKHDGHEFEADVPGTDSYSHMQAGAYGTAVFSGTKYMLVKQKAVTELELAEQFPEADVILLEGMKYSPYPKIELVRQGNSAEPVCDPKTLFAVVTDIEGFRTPSGWEERIPVIGFSDVHEIAELLLDGLFIQRQLSMAVLAGGLSSRMGQDKAGLQYKGQSFLQCQTEKGQRLGIGDILVSGYRGQCGWNVVQDHFREKGPLGGLEAVLREAVHDYVLVLPVDVPQLPLSALRTLVRAGRRTSAPAVVLSHGGRTEPLIGIYRAKLAELAKKRLSEGRGSVFAFLKEAGCQVCETGEPEEFFRNINTPEAYEALTATHRKTYSE
ncbi:MAG: molybdopterin-guanine dinucleotide biosynthesis protein B [Eubacteriales bacterium]|nr:molybdopterin-guanine dinucleotide biosynthesis protein B [Eubacteriales bacterium]